MKTKGTITAAAETLPAIGARVKLVGGFGTEERGTVVDIITGKWGKSALVHMDDGSEEYVSSITNTGIGCYVL